MTHLRHNLAAEATEIPQCSSLSGSPPQAWAVPLEFPSTKGQMGICLRRRELIAALGGAAVFASCRKRPAAGNVGGRLAQHPKFRMGAMVPLDKS